MVLQVKIYQVYLQNLAMDKPLVGKEKTEYLKLLNKVLKNPDDLSR